MVSLQSHKMLGNTTLFPKLQPGGIGSSIPDEGGISATEINIVLAGTIILAICLLLITACCVLHSKIKPDPEIVSLNTFPWSDGIQIYTVSREEETTGIYLPPTPSAPPTYETAVQVQKKEDAEKPEKPRPGYPTITQRKVGIDEDGLPTYEVAIQLPNNGYM